MHHLLLMGFKIVKKALQGRNSLEKHAYLNGLKIGRQLPGKFQKQAVTHAWMTYAKSTEPIRSHAIYCQQAKAWYEGVEEGAVGMGMGPGPFSENGLYTL